MLLLCLVRNLTLPSRLLNFVPPHYINVRVLCGCPLLPNPAPNCPLCRKVLHSGVSTLDSRLSTLDVWKTPQVCCMFCYRHRPPTAAFVRNVACGSRISLRASTSDNFTCWLQRHPELRTPNSELRTPEPNTKHKLLARPFYTFCLLSFPSRLAFPHS